MSITKDDLNKALEEQSKTIISAIDSSAIETRNELFDRIDRLEKFYDFDRRLQAVEKKVGISA